MNMGEFIQGSDSEDSPVRAADPKEEELKETILLREREIRRLKDRFGMSRDSAEKLLDEYPSNP